MKITGDLKFQINGTTIDTIDLEHRIDRIGGGKIHQAITANAVLRSQYYLNKRGIVDRPDEEVLQIYQGLVAMLNQSEINRRRAI